MKIATVFNLCLFPPSYLLERISRADVILTLSDKAIDERNHVNRCPIRTAIDRVWSLTIPIDQKGVPADECQVVDQIPWRSKLYKDVQRAYAGLKFSDTAVELVRAAIPQQQSEWLVDHLMHSFLTVLDGVGWKREVLRGDSRQRRRYANDDEYLLNLCLEAEADALLVGHTQKMHLNQRMFRKNSVEILVQDWYGSNFTAPRDSILDIIARYGVNDLAKKLV